MQDAIDYFTTSGENIYALRNLPEEVVAVLFAKYSRSHGSARAQIIDMLNAEGVAEIMPIGEKPSSETPAKAKAFLEKYVVGYGHASVAEHASAHLAIEGVSILASKEIEDGRLAAYTEKSTRYIKFDRSMIYTPRAFEEELVYTDTIDLLMQTYDEMHTHFFEHFKQFTPRDGYASSQAFEAACNATACDTVRMLLPLATKTNLGMTANARQMGHSISKLLSSESEECRRIGLEMHLAASQVLPTLLKYVKPLDSITEPREKLRSLYDEVMDEVDISHTNPPVFLLGITSDGEEQLLQGLAAAILYEHGNHEMADVMEACAAAGIDKCKEVIATYIADRRHHFENGEDQGPVEPPRRAFETEFIQLEILMNYGAWRDIQRMRMNTFLQQPFTGAHGYDTPRLVFENPILFDQWTRCMVAARDAFEELLGIGHSEREASYVLPMAFKHKFIMSMNLRQLFYVAWRRSTRQGHPDYRRIAQGMGQALESISPWLAKEINVDYKDYSLTR